MPGDEGRVLVFMEQYNLGSYVLILVSQARPNQPSADRFQYHARGRKGLVTLAMFPCASGMH